MPKKPDPNHPLAQAAAAFEIESQGTQTPSPTPNADATPSEAVPTLPVTSVAAQTPTPALVPESGQQSMDRMQAMFDTMMGRVDVLNVSLKEKESAVKTKDDNITFLEGRLNDTVAQLRTESEARAKLESELETTNAIRGFQSEKVDPEQFAEVFRGIQPHLARRDAQIQKVLDDNKKLVEAIEAVRGEADVKVGKVRTEILESQIRRGAPEIHSLMKTREFETFLHEAIPGTRRTRFQELQDAYKDGDDEFIVSMVADYKKRGNPVAVPNAEPPRVLTNQQPKPAAQEEPITEDMLSMAFQKQLNGEITRAEYKQLRELARKQGVA